VRLHHNRQGHQLFSPPVIRLVNQRISRLAILLDSRRLNHPADLALNLVLTQLGNLQEYQLGIHLVNLLVSLPGSLLVSLLASHQVNLLVNPQCNQLDNLLRSHQGNPPGNLVHNLQEFQARSHLVNHLTSRRACLLGNLLAFQAVNLQVTRPDNQPLSPPGHLHWLQQQQPQQIRR
jgi:hypothetical protein